MDWRERDKALRERDKALRLDRREWVEDEDERAGTIAAPHEESFIESCRRRVEEQYASHPTGCGGSFGELLCFELHHGGPAGTGLTFGWLAAKWGISLSVLGELISDHCRRLEPLVEVNHEYVVS